MDPDIHFGEFEQASPTTRQRPDRNGQLTVVEVGTTATEDLPIFVDIDAMREIVSHAHSDRRVELGGVLLGGQYQDDEGRAFVLVSDCLRARHYESTKGSFKFTHDTWEQITREREQMPAGLEMVGWYHTHPGWGVFLSGLDLFICDNFFNKPLDVALVVDPCRGDTGIFQWTGDARERIRRTGGYYLFGSRFRRDELQQLASELETTNMSESQRAAVTPGTIIMPPPPPIPWGYSLAILGMFSVQFCLVALLAIRLLFPIASDGGQSNLSAKSTNGTEPGDELAGLERLRKREATVDAKLEVLELVVRQQGNVPDGVLQSLAARISENAEFRHSLRAQQSLARELDTKVAALESTLTEVRRSDDNYREEVTRLQGELDEWKSKLPSTENQLASDFAAPESSPKIIPWWSNWLADGRSLGLGTVLGAAIVGITWYLTNRKPSTGVESQSSGERDA